MSYARTSALRVRERESGEVGRVFGLRCGELLGNCDPVGSLPRTLELSLFEGLPMLLTRLPRSGMTVNGRIYEQVTWVRRTEGKGSGLLLTPQKWDTPSVADAHPRALNRKGPYWGKGQKHLQAQIFNRMWPTPCQDDVNYRKEKYKQGGTALSTATGGQLNPTWVEWLLGYPLGWTDLNASVIPLSLKSQSSCSSK